MTETFLNGIWESSSRIHDVKSSRNSLISQNFQTKVVFNAAIICNLEDLLTREYCDNEVMT